MVFKARQTLPGFVGYCVALDVGAHDVEVRDINCNNTWAGVMVSPGTIGTNSFTTEERQNAVSNVYVTGLRFDGRLATGILSNSINNLTMGNITWDGVTVLAGEPVVASLCYQKIRGMTGHPFYCGESMAATVTNVWFKRFRGKLPAEADRARNIEYPPKSTLEYHFEDWESTPVV